MSMGATTTRLTRVTSRRVKGVNSAGREPPLDTAEVLRIAQAQILVADALTACEERVGKLLGIQFDVTAHVLEPLHRVARGVLQPQRFSDPFGLVGGER